MTNDHEAQSGFETNRWMAIVRRLPASARLGAALVAVAFIAGFAGLVGLVPGDPYEFDFANRFASPGWDHWLGTDNLGRDIFSRVVVGSGIAMTVSIVGVGIAMILGLMIGTAAGYGPRWFDSTTIFLLDSLRTFPTILLAMLVVVIAGPSVFTILVIVVVSLVPGYARVARTQTLALRNEAFILAERSLGASPLRVIREHVIPNVFAPLLVIGCMDIPTVVAIEAGLSFIGLGVRPPEPSWGTLLQDGYVHVRATPWLLVAGSIPLALVTLGFTFLGEGLRDALDPKGRR